MAVTESSGNGYALYNVIYAPDIDTVWTNKTTYPYAVIAQSPDFMTMLFLTNTVPTQTDNIISVGSDFLVYAFDPYPHTGDPITEWTYMGSGAELTDFPGIEVSGYFIWATVDIIDTADNEVKHEYGEPISLDSYNVLIYDGNSSGLTALEYEGETFVRVMPYVDVDNAVALGTYYGMRLGMLSNIVTDYGWSVYNHYMDDTLVIASNGTNVSIPEGIYLWSNGTSSNYTFFFAYRTAPTFDKTTFLSGLAMGLTGKGNPTFEGSDVFGKGYLAGAKLRARRVRQPVAYLYNGVRLPKLPEWDKEAYPYAIIQTAKFNNYTKYYFDMLAEWNVGYSVLADSYVISGHGGARYEITWYDGENMPLSWENYRKFDGSWSRNASDLAWSNTDVIYNGTTIFSATKPVPVYE